MTAYRVDVDTVHPPPLYDPVDGPGLVSAREFGERLAGRLFDAAPADLPDVLVLSMLEQAPELFDSLQARVEVVRTKLGCAVVRMANAADGSTPCPCELVAGFLEALPLLTYGVTGSLIENACVRRGARNCLFTLLWDAGAGSRRVPTGSEPSVASPRPAGRPRSLAPAERAPVQTTPVQTTPAHTAPEPMPVLPAAPPTPTPMAAPPIPDRAAAPVAPTAGGPQAPTAPAPTQPDPAGADAADGDGDGEGEGEGEGEVQEARNPARRSPVRVGRRSWRPHIPVWLKRRGWLLVLAMVAGVAGGTYAAKHSVVSYQAQSTMVVQSGASAIGPGGAAEAGQLAITYATVIPTDTAILEQAATRLGISEETLSSRLTVSVQTGTAVFVIDYKAPTSTEAVAGAAEVARVVGGTGVSSSTIPSGTVSVVDLATDASASGSMAKYGKPLGGILGLVVGLILALAAERADPRVDTAADLAGVVGSPASLVPDDLSPSELSRAIALEPKGADGVTIIPLARADEALSKALTGQLRSAWPLGAGDKAVGVSPPFETDPAADAGASGPTVLVVSTGETVRRAAAVAGRLQAVHRGPVWAVLVTRRARRKLLAGDS